MARLLHCQEKFKAAFCLTLKSGVFGFNCFSWCLFINFPNHGRHASRQDWQWVKEVIKAKAFQKKGIRSLTKSHVWNFNQVPWVPVAAWLHEIRQLVGPPESQRSQGCGLSPQNPAPRMLILNTGKIAHSFWTLSNWLAYNLLSLKTSLTTAQWGLTTSRIQEKKRKKEKKAIECT